MRIQGGRLVLPVMLAVSMLPMLQDSAFAQAAGAASAARSGGQGATPAAAQSALGGTSAGGIGVGSGKPFTAPSNGTAAGAAPVTGPLNQQQLTDMAGQPVSSTLSVPLLNQQSTGGGQFGFSTQGYGFGLGIGWNGVSQGSAGSAMFSPEEERLLREAIKRNLLNGGGNNSSTRSASSEVFSRTERRGNRIVAVREQMVNGKMLRSEGTIVQEYGTPSGRVASRNQTRTFARVYPKK